MTNIRWTKFSSYLRAHNHLYTCSVRTFVLSYETFVLPNRYRSHYWREPLKFLPAYSPQGSKFTTNNQREDKKQVFFSKIMWKSKKKTRFHQTSGIAKLIQYFCWINDFRNLDWNYLLVAMSLDKILENFLIPPLWQDIKNILNCLN